MNKNSCPVCFSSKTNIFLSRDQVPVHQNMIIDNFNDAVSIERGFLRMAVCLECGFIFNQAFDFNKLSYGTQYDNTQTCSSSFEGYVSELVNYLVYEKNVKNCSIVEVGCGMGLFIKKLVAAEEWGNTGYGFDPSFVGRENDFDGRLKIEKRYYDSECSNIPADIVICRHVIEHIQEPFALLHAIKQALSNSSKARVFFETPCAEWILQNQVIWDFFYEHCSYYTAQSLRTVFEIAGFQVESVRNIFSGQYLWLEATIPDKKIKIQKNVHTIPDLAEKFAVSEAKLIKDWEIKIKKLAEKGKIALWGAGAKGVTFANLIDPERQLIDCLIDLNPNKQGKFIPGTGHYVIRYDEIPIRKITDVILMNPNYYEENLALLRKADITANIVV